VNRIEPIAGPGRKTERDLVQLVFVSSADPGLTSADLDAIATVSRARNTAAGLTGFLLYQGDSFYCVLEGPRHRVFQRMETIICDRRHSRVEILREDSVTNRRFDNWSFGILPKGQRSPTAGHPEAFIRSLAARLN
jgi:hypothetical protein